MATETHELIEELVPSGGSQAQYDTIDIRRRKDQSGSRSLKVAFQRTCRVSDNGSTNNLPPNMGEFPLFKVSDYKETLPPAMAARGGYFFPMYQREAMWISFNSNSKFAVKVYVGGVNAISGEPSLETEQTKQRRYKLLSSGKPIQDYVVTPQQLWLDGVASQDGKVRQFVAMPIGSGYSVEAQITGADLINGLQIEVVPAKEAPAVGITIATITGKRIAVTASTFHTVDEIKSRIQDVEGIPPDQQRLICDGKQLEDPFTLGSYGVSAGAVILLVLRLRGGGYGPNPQMGLAAGGLIKQTILPDHSDPTIWDSDNGVIFNVQILNSTHFKAVTGMAPPSTPVTSKTYAQYGLPYYDFFDEKPSGISGNFSEVDSVATKDLQGPLTLEKMKGAMEVIEDTQNPVVLLDQEGKRVGFRPVKMMEKEIPQESGGMGV